LTPRIVHSRSSPLVPTLSLRLCTSTWIKASISLQKRSKIHLQSYRICLAPATTRRRSHRPKSPLSLLLPPLPLNLPLIRREWTPSCRSVSYSCHLAQVVERRQRTGSVISSRVQTGAGARSSTSTAVQLQLLEARVSSLASRLLPSVSLELDAYGVQRHRQLLIARSSQEDERRVSGVPGCMRCICYHLFAPVAHTVLKHKANATILPLRQSTRIKSSRRALLLSHSS
jgi:hypothetical protein